MKKILKSKTSKLIVVVLVLGLVLGVLYGMGVLQEVLGGQYVEAPTFMYYECAPASEPVLGSEKLIRNSGEWIACPSNTDQCDIKFFLKEKPPIVGAYRLIYERCTVGGSCGGSKSVQISFTVLEQNNWQDIMTLYNVRIDETIWVQYQVSYVPLIWNDYSGGYSQPSYQPFILWKNSIFAGGRTQYTTEEQGCDFNFNDQSSLIDFSSISIGHTESTSRHTHLEPYETRNYLDRYVPLSIENVQFVDYLGEKGYCLSNKIYGIDTIETPSRTYRVVDVSHNSVLKSVECCPGDIRPSYTCENFQWIEIVESECSLFNPCAGVEPEPYTGTSTIRYACEDGKCVSKIEEVECTSNSVCRDKFGDNYACDMKTYECYQTAGVEPGEPPAIGDGIECEWWQVYRAEGQGALFGLFPGRAAGCYVSGIVYVLVIGGIITFLIVIVVLIKNIFKKHSK